MHQSTLPFDKDKTIQERFELFIAEHPDVMDAFRKMAAQLRAVGKKRIGSKRILEVIRFDYDTSGKDTDGWKINNSFSSRFARRLIAEDPSYASLFELRELKSS